MTFIVFLITAAAALAVTAAFFSVYGLAILFAGAFWMVVVMGTALEMGKLVAVSYLYRFWDKTNIWLKSYLMLGILVLMVLTSVGIYGILSGGYQTEAIPLKQINQQVVLLEQEKEEKLLRKRQIDEQIAQLPSNMVKGRERLVKQFREEQVQVTTRLNELDAAIQELRVKQINIEAHVGPITYIAKAFGLDPDNATSYLIILIVLGFDPMAVALTLAVNIALRERELQKRAAAETAKEPIILVEEIKTPEPPAPEPQQEPVVEKLAPKKRVYSRRTLAKRKEAAKKTKREPKTKKQELVYPEIVSAEEPVQEPVFEPVIDVPPPPPQPTLVESKAPIIVDANPPEPDPNGNPPHKEWKLALANGETEDLSATLKTLKEKPNKTKADRDTIKNIEEFLKSS